ncbi:MAG: cell division protein FtsX [Paludibacteraceae bacterium]|nr:cell division protein FtsX [Paludibacteraceae bacterium]
MANQQFKNRKFRTSHLTSTLSMSLVLFLVGMVSLLLFVARDLGVQVRENINLSVILEDEITNTYRQRIQKYIESAPFTKSVIYVSKEEALKEHVASMGENPEDFLDYNPLKASFEVKLKAEFANADSVNMIEEKIKTFDDINRVAYQKDMVNLVNDNVTRISLVLLGIAAVLLILSMALINNTVRLSIYANRFLINTMKLVGATSWFVRKPYIARGMINGLIAAFLSLLMLAVLVYYILSRFGLSAYSVNPVSAMYVAGIVILTGVLLSAFSSFMAVGRYLKMTRNDMYFV